MALSAGKLVKLPYPTNKLWVSTCINNRNYDSVCTARMLRYKNDQDLDFDDIAEAWCLEETLEVIDEFCGGHEAEILVEYSLDGRKLVYTCPRGRIVHERKD